jgi:hypothetical protein
MARCAALAPGTLRMSPEEPRHEESARQRSTGAARGAALASLLDEGQRGERAQTLAMRNVLSAHEVRIQSSRRESAT